MTLNKYINNLLIFAKNNPEVAEYECVYGVDDEGNSYDRVKFTPTVMKADSLENQNLELTEVNNPTEGNVVCIN
jgi:hypothetical protein